VVDGGRAFVFYMVHPGRAAGGEELAFTKETAAVRNSLDFRMSVIQVFFLKKYENCFMPALSSSFSVLFLFSCFDFSGMQMNNTRNAIGGKPPAHPGMF